MTPYSRKNPLLLSAPAQDLLLMCVLICAVLMAGFSLAGCSTTAAAAATERAPPIIESAPPVIELWAGIPLRELDSLGLSGLALSEREDAWRAGNSDGGLVRVYLFDSVLEAEKAFAFHRISVASLSTATAPPRKALQGDESFGDGLGLFCVRHLNVVVITQSHTGQAGAMAQALLDQLVTEAPDGIGQTRTLQGETLNWDSVGRRINPSQ